MKKRRIVFIFIWLISAIFCAKAQKFLKPQWEMPIYFQDSTGQRDTVWIGCDPRASPFNGVDTEFENYISIDTSKFNAYLYEMQPNNMARKREISSWPYAIGAEIKFTHGKLPLKVTWEEDSLNSSYLSSYYPDISPRPRARIDLTFEMLPIFNVDCPIAVDTRPDIILTGYITWFYTCLCALSDSLVIYDSSHFADEIWKIIGNSTMLEFRPHNYIYGGGGINENNFEIVIYPNPFTDKITFSNPNQKDLNVKIYNIFGKLEYENNFNQIENIIDLTTLNNGLYFVLISDNENTIFKYKIIKTTQ